MFPQFWAEEGSYFFVQARERPILLNLTGYFAGYFDLLLRLTEQIAAAVPLAAAPLVLVLFAIAIQAAVPVFIVSSRCAGWLGVFPVRFLVAILYCGMPNSFEVHCILLHSRVHLAVLATLVVLSAPPRSLLGRIFDSAILILAGLSGPFVLLLAPVAAWRHWQIRSPQTRRNSLILGVALLVTLVALAGSIGMRFRTARGASLLEAVRIIGGQFAVGFFLGQKNYAMILRQPYFDFVAGFILFALSILLLLIVRQKKSEAYALLFIGAGALTIALAAPIGAAPGMTEWRSLWSIPGHGQRYYFVPMAMLLFLLAAAAGHGRNRIWRASMFALFVVVAAMGVRSDWTLPRFTDFRFSHYAALYRALPPGDSITIPINPPGWQMTLKKPGAQRR